MPGYEKFTLAEVIYPEDEAKVSKNQIWKKSISVLLQVFIICQFHIIDHFLFQLAARLDNAEDTVLVDTPVDIDPRTKNKKSENKSEDKVVEDIVNKNDKISPDEFGKS